MFCSRILLTAIYIYLYFNISQLSLYLALKRNQYTLVPAKSCYVRHYIFSQWLYLRQHWNCDNILFEVFSILFRKNINIYFLTMFLTTTSNVVLIPAVTASKAFVVQRKFSFNLTNPSKQFSPDVSVCVRFISSKLILLITLYMVTGFVYRT